MYMYMQCIGPTYIYTYVHVCMYMYMYSIYAICHPSVAEWALVLAKMHPVP